MLTKKEREEIAERFRNYDKAEYVTLYSGMYDGLLGEHVPKETTVKKDRMELASRILELCDTSNMIELPVDKDGIPFKRGDTVYESDGTEHIVDGYAFSRANAKIVSVVDLINNTRILFETDELTHKRPVTIASLAEQIRDILDDDDDISAWTFSQFVHIADQLEQLGDPDD